MPPLIVDTDTILSASQTFEGIHILAGATLTFDPEKTIVVESHGNVVVEGILRMRPRKATTVHTLRIAGTREADFVGGHTQAPLDSDRGVWVFGAGQLDLQGYRKTAWTRERARAIRWSASDELVVTPTAPGDYTGFAPYRLGDLVPIGAPGLPAEVMNLTRNVIVEGEPTGRSHIFIQSQVPQYLRYVTVRHMGPRQPIVGQQHTEGVRGRYPIHFHMCGTGSRGSRLEGVLVHQSGNRAFVPHASHGIVFRNCIAYAIWEEPFWWDQAVEMDKSDAVVWKNCLAALIHEDPPFRGFRLSAFVLGKGEGNKCIGCVAVGVQGNKSASGFTWPEAGSGLWEFRDCVAHNNKVNGLFVWQNTPTLHLIEDFVAYHCGQAGVEHGAYGNRYHYQRVQLIANRIGIVLHALGTHRDPPPMLWEQINIAGSVPSLQTRKHNSPAHQRG